MNWCWPRERTLGYKSVRHSVVIWVLLSELDSNPDIDHVLMRPDSKAPRLSDDSSSLVSMRWLDPRRFFGSLEDCGTCVRQL